MIGSLKEYILRIIIAALLCAIVKNFVGKSSAVSAILKTLCAVFLSLTIFSPLVQLDISSITDYLYSFSVDANSAVDAGSAYASADFYSSIKEDAEAYILEKAALYKAELSVEVTLSDDDLPIPCSVILNGQVSPYARSKLTRIISKDLGIPKENQTWI